MVQGVVWVSGKGRGEGVRGDGYQWVSEWREYNGINYQLKDISILPVCINNYSRPVPYM